MWEGHNYPGLSRSVNRPRLLQFVTICYTLGLDKFAPIGYTIYILEKRIKHMKEQMRKTSPFTSANIAAIAAKLEGKTLPVKTEKPKK